jgi:hypothetical protein
VFIRCSPEPKLVTSVTIVVHQMFGYVSPPVASLSVTRIDLYFPTGSQDVIIASNRTNRTLEVVCID